VRERFSDYAYEELTPTTASTEYDLSLLELDELKQLKASLEKRLEFSSTPEIHDVFEYNPFLHSPKDMPTTAPVTRVQLPAEYQYTDASYTDNADYGESDYYEANDGPFRGESDVGYEYNIDEYEQPIYEDLYQDTHEQTNVHEYETFVQPQHTQDNIHHQQQDNIHQQQQDNIHHQQQEVLQEQADQKHQHQNVYDHQTEFDSGEHVQQNPHEHVQHNSQENVEHKYGHLLEEQVRLEQIFTNEKAVALDPNLVYKHLSTHLEDTHLHDSLGTGLKHQYTISEEADNAFHTFIHHLQDIGMHEKIIHSAQDHYSTQDNVDPLVRLMEIKPHRMRVMIRPKEFQPRLMIRLLYERVPHVKIAHKDHLDDPVIEDIPLYRKEMDYHIDDLPKGKYIVCAEASLDNIVIQNNCFETIVDRLDNNKLQSGVILVISVAIFVVVGVIFYAIYYRIQSIRKKRSEKEFRTKVESIATKEKELAEAEKSDSYITFTNEPFEERCIM